MVILGIFIQLAAVIIHFTQRNVHKEKEQILNVYLDEQKNHYEYLESRCSPKKQGLSWVWAGKYQGQHQ